MTKKYGLGKGLQALISDNLEDQNLDKDKVKKISINLIKPNKAQPRKNFDSDKIIKLAESIKQYGVIQPIILKKENSNYIIIAGERRWRAAKYIGLKEIPSIVMELEEKEILEISLIENLQREDLNPIEEALTYKKLINDFDMTHEELSKAIGKSRVSITNSMRLLNLDDKVKEFIIQGVISEGHGRALLALENKEQQYILSKKIIDENLSVREIEAFIKSLNNKKKSSKEDKYKHNPYLNDVQNKMQEYFGTKVFIKDKKNKGKIEIEYYSDEDLQRILELMKL